MVRERGLTTIELLIATALTVLVIGVALALARSLPDAFAVQNEAADMQQRVRVASNALLQDVVAAAAVRPYRSDGSSPDPPGTVKSDTITALGPGVKTYWLKADDRTATYQLMMYAGGTSFDVPVADNVVALAFAYFGDPRPPTIVRPLSDPTGPWTTYGPAPPLAPVAPFGARENCVFIDNGTEMPDPRLSMIPASGPGPILLAPEWLNDGPWCPDESAPARWDADLLRVRTVSISLRVQAALASLRGPANALFMHGGSSSSGQRWAPDIEVHFDVSPRNLNLGA